MKQETQDGPIEIYTLEEAANTLKVTRKTMETYVRNGTVKSTKLGGRWLITKDNLMAAIQGTPTGEK